MRYLIILALLCPSACLAQTAQATAGIDFDGAHLTIGMSKTQVFALLVSPLFHIVRSPGGTDADWVIQRSDGGGDQGALSFDDNGRLSFAERTWDTTDTAYSAMHVTSNLLHHLRSEGFIQCLVVPLDKSYAPDLRDGDDILVDCGQKRVEISAYRYVLHGTSQETVEITEEVLASDPRSKK